VPIASKTWSCTKTIHKNHKSRNGCMIQTTMCCLMRDLLIQPSTETDLKALRFPCFLQLPSCEAGQKLSSMFCSMSAGGWYLSRFTPDKLTYWNRYCSSLPNCCFVLLPANSRQSNMASWSSIGKFMNIQKFMAPHGSNKKDAGKMYTWSRSNKVCCEDAGFIEIREWSNALPRTLKVSEENIPTFGVS